jgi:hypothetical protein
MKTGDAIKVGWKRLAEPDAITCTVIEVKDFGGLNVFDGPTPVKVQYLSGKPARVVWVGSQNRWVFA